MSNCIHFHDPEVFFSAQEIDLPAFQKRCARLRNEVPQLMSDGTTQEREDQNFAWYLSSNSFFAEDGVTIQFGEGNSTHTHRDFRYTVAYLLAPYMRRFKAHTFTLSDEYDGFQDRFKHTVVFKPAKRNPQ